MIVRTTDEITDTDRDITSTDGNWRSKRIVLAGDGVGFSFHETTIAAGSVNEFHYANHVEAVWLIEGDGILTDLDSGEVHDENGVYPLVVIPAEGEAAQEDIGINA